MRDAPVAPAIVPLHTGRAVMTRRTVTLAGPDPAWPQRFETERAALAALLGPDAWIHHIGSTAVPGLVAKPVVDILVEVPDVTALDHLAVGFRALGYTPRGENGIPGRRYFVKGAPERTHHLHAFPAGSHDAVRHLALRDPPARVGCGPPDVRGGQAGCGGGVRRRHPPLRRAQARHRGRTAGPGPAVDAPPSPQRKPAMTTALGSLTSIRFGRLLLTGAAGGLGRMLRPRLARCCDVLRVSDIADLGEAAPGEELVQVPLEDKAAVRGLLAGVDAVVHLGGVSTEHAWETVVGPNVHGVVHLYEAARVHGVRRIVFASSNHATGFYRQDQVIGTDAPPRADGFYGLSKAFGEQVGRLYWDRWGIETVALRIGSSFPEPRDRRMLATWLSHDDLERLVVAALTAPVVGFSVVYGMSDNRASFWDNTGARHLGYRPLDSADAFRAVIEARQPRVDPGDPATVFQGGGFVTQGPFD